MQSLVASPRQALTSAAVQALIEEGSRIEVLSGLELLDSDEALIADISDALIVGEVFRVLDNRIQGMCRLTLGDELAWGSARVRPYMVLDDGTTEARFDLGIYLLSTPEKRPLQTPVTYDVQGFDKTLILDTPVGSTYRVASGTGALTAAAAVIALTGETAVSFTPAGTEPTLPSDRVWPLAQENTYLRIVNDLLGLAGYEPVWCDQRGNYRSRPYQAPAERPTEWTYYEADPDLSLIGEDRTERIDVFDTPNTWVFVRSDPSLGAPTTGDGLYTVTNQSDGPASIDARGGLVRRKVEFLDVATQTALEARGDRIVDADQAIAVTMGVTTGLNPLHLHDDIVALVEAGQTRRWRVEEWRLPLVASGQQMTQTWRLIG